LSRIPKPRLYSELELILKEKDPVWIVRRLSDLGLGTPIHPALVLDKSHLALLGEAQEVLAWFSLLFLEEKVEKWAVLFLALLDPLPADDAKKLAKDLGVRSRVREWVRICKDEGESVILRLISMTSLSRKVIHDLLSPLPTEVILYLMARAKHPDIKRYISLYFTVRLPVGGGDLLDLGYRPGPRFKEIFDLLLERKLAGELRSKKEEIAYLLSHAPPTTDSMIE
jgi:tRNA nucleotidyltransferase (CCA-adding enzyme)